MNQQTHGVEASIIYTEDTMSGISIGDSFKIYSDFIETPFYFFKSRTIPEISITNLSETINSRNYNFIGSYNQYENVPIQYYIFNLYNEDLELLDTTDKVYSANITYNFDGFTNGEVYYIELVCSNQDNVEVSTGKKQFKADYTEPNVDVTLDYQVLEDKDAIRVILKPDKTSVPNFDGEYSIESNFPFEGTNSAYIEKGNVVYDNVSEEPLEIDKDSYTVFMSTRLNNGFDGKIVELSNNEESRGIELDNYSFYDTIKTSDSVEETIEGRNVEIDGKSGGKIELLKLRGESEQKTRSGKNKLPYNYYDGNSKTVNGITFTVNEDKSITANGTATANASFSITNPNNYGIAAGSYKLVGENNAYTKTAIRGSYKKADGTITYISSVSSFTIPKNTTNIQIYVVILQGETVNNVTFYPMLLNSTETDLTFEAGGASPSPDYPSPIENVEGKNKFNKSNMTEATWDNGKTNTVTLLEDGRIQSTANYAQWAAKCIDIPNLKANTDYVVSGKIISSTADNAMIIVKGYKNNTLSNIIYHRYAVGTRFELSFNSSDYEKIGISLSGDNSTLDTTYTTIFDEIQLEEGIVATDYVPYNSLEIKDIGENLYNKKDISGTIMAEVKINELTAGTYTLSALATSSDTDRTQCLVYDATNNKNLGYLNRNVRSSFTFTLEKPTKKLNFYASTTYDLGKNDTFKFADIQIEQNTTATPYKTYQEQKVDFPLSEGQKLYEGSYLASDGIHHKRKQVVLDGSEDENWRLWGASLSNVERFYINLEKHAKQNGASLCSHFRLSSTDSDTEHFRWSTSSGVKNQFVIFIDKSKATTVAELKTWLQSNPITVEYELAEPEIVPYTTAQQEAWDNSQNIASFEGKNYIITDPYGIYIKIEYSFGVTKEKIYDIYSSTKFALQSKQESDVGYIWNDSSVWDNTKYWWFPKENLDSKQFKITILPTSSSILEVE